MLNITQRQNESLTVLDLEGDVIMGGNSAKFGKAITELVNEQKTNILLNFQKVRYLDSSGTGEIMSGLTLVKEKGGKLKFMNLSPKVEEVLSLSSLLPILEIYENETAAAKE